MLCRYIPKAVNKPPYANGTAMVGDSVMYTWKGFFHGVVLSTSCEPRLPICCFWKLTQSVWCHSTWLLMARQFVAFAALQDPAAGFQMLAHFHHADVQQLHRMEMIGLETDVGH